MVGGFLGAAVRGDVVEMWIPATFALEGIHLVARNRPEEPPFDWKINAKLIDGLTVDDTKFRVSIRMRDGQMWELLGQDFLWDKWLTLVDQIGLLHKIDRIVFHDTAKDTIFKVHDNPSKSESKRQLPRRSSISNVHDMATSKSEVDSMNCQPKLMRSASSASKISVVSGTSMSALSGTPPSHPRDSFPSSARTSALGSGGLFLRTFSKEYRPLKRRTSDVQMGEPVDKENCLQMKFDETRFEENSPKAKAAAEHWIISLGDAYSKYVQSSNSALLLSKPELTEILQQMGKDSLHARLTETGVESALHRKRITFEIENSLGKT